ncbi:glycosyltransferase family 25 protein [Aerophototrophica crusticola]|uniref:Glycosyltransferase family 25 protein n=1 Tax=Aerophototrophica crusticola TaxID=1709002 RepID=A0A858R9J7_9PROT|nr:glycosyltransferase family 25 protein [Rhodospirillaceae bacterium B3]
MSKPLDIAVISLPRAGERRAHMARQLDALGLPFHFFDAVDGRAVGAEGLARLGLSVGEPLRSRVPLNPGEVGCYASHLSLLDGFLASGSEALLVLEDDAILDPDLPDVIRAVLDLPHPWDVVKLGGVATVPMDPVRTLGEGRTLARPWKPAYGSHAYLVSRAGAALLTDRRHRSMRVPYDALLDWYWHSGADLYAVTPWAVTTAESLVSSIQDAGGRWLHEPNRLDRLRISLDKARSKRHWRRLDRDRTA